MFSFSFLKAFNMFYQEKHPGEKSAHLFETNKRDLLIMSLLLRRQIGSLMALLVSPPTWVSMPLPWLQKNTSLAPLGWLAMGTPWTGNLKITVASKPLRVPSLAFLETFVRIPGTSHESNKLLNTQLPFPTLKGHGIIPKSGHLALYILSSPFLSFTKY